jgi:hypothetical protein
VQGIHLNKLHLLLLNRYQAITHHECARIYAQYDFGILLQEERYF